MSDNLGIFYIREKMFHVKHFSIYRKNIKLFHVEHFVSYIYRKKIKILVYIRNKRKNV